jgi:enoyl-CoA hydratase
VPDASVLIERRDDVGVITINRPQAFNALNADVLHTLADAVEAFGRTGARAIIITGSGEKAFSAGADLEELAGLDAAAAHRLLSAGQRTVTGIEKSPVPVITAVNGLALGGGFELILASTLPILAEHASLGLPESGLGLIPGYGGTQRLPAAIGRAGAAYVMLTGKRLSAQRSYDLGLTPVQPVPVGDLMAVALETARQIASKGPRAVCAILTALQTSAADPRGLALESALAGIATGGDEAAEGISAFRQKRSPDYNSISGKE